jgi:hypothetical protein
VGVDRVLGDLMSLWWSFILTAFGATGMLLSYRSYSSYAGPAFGLWIQLVWVTYAIESMQWWFIVSAFLYGGAHLYGIQKRRRERSEAKWTLKRPALELPPLIWKEHPSLRGRSIWGGLLDSLPNIAPPAEVEQKQYGPNATPADWGDIDD